MTRLLDSLNPEIAAGVIDAGQDGPSLMLAIKQAADEGALIALLVDRTQPGAATQPAEFFGAPARFPVAPWMIAAVLKLPVSLAFGLYRGGNRYDLVFETFEDQGLDLPRAQRATRMAALIQRYAARRSEEHTSELQSLMRISYAVFCLKKKKQQHRTAPKNTLQLPDNIPTL